MDSMGIEPGTHVALLADAVERALAAAVAAAAAGAAAALGRRQQLVQRVRIRVFRELDLRSDTGVTESMSCR